jgi:hypothetical protein
MSLKLIILSACLLLTASVIAAIDPNPGNNIARGYANSEAL